MAGEELSKNIALPVMHSSSSFNFEMYKSGWSQVFELMGRFETSMAHFLSGERDCIDFLDLGGMSRSCSIFWNWDSSS